VQADVGLSHSPSDFVFSDFVFSGLPEDPLVQFYQPTPSQLQPFILSKVRRIPS
jgi:hypothetical protein